MNTFIFAALSFTFLVAPVISNAQMPIGQQTPIDPAICKADQSTIVQRTRLNLEPNYFAKLYAVRNVATVISSAKTYAVNLANGDLINMQGTYDPVPTPDEKFLTTIDSSVGPLYFQSSDLFERAAPADGYHSWTATGFNVAYAYQSLGWLQGAATGPYTYRFLDDNNSGSVSYRDDYFEVPAGGRLADATLHSGHWVHACANVGANMKLPMISKDGKKISFYNVDKSVTQVYDIDEHGVCTNQQNLPFVTGKVDFSFDGNRVAFHMGRVEEPAQWFETADTTRKLDTYVYDLKTKQLTRLTDVVHGNAYFPTFKKNGQVGFLLQETTIAGDVHYSYVISDPAHGVSLAQFPDLTDSCNCHLDGFAELVGIGLLKDRVCHQANTTHTLESESAVPLTLTHQQCVDLVQKYWANNKNEVVDLVNSMNASIESRKAAISAKLSAITESQLMTACSAKDLSVVKEAKVVGTKVIATSLNPEERIQTTCSKCHGGDHPMSGIPFDLKNILNIPIALREKMAAKITAGEMPPGGLNVNERARLTTYLVGHSP